jgi:hypothetical protein
MVKTVVNVMGCKDAMGQGAVAEQLNRTVEVALEPFG